MNLNKKDLTFSLIGAYIPLFLLFVHMVMLLPIIPHIILNPMNAFNTLDKGFLPMVFKEILVLIFLVSYNYIIFHFSRKEKKWPIYLSGVYLLISLWPVFGVIKSIIDITKCDSGNCWAIPGAFISFIVFCFVIVNFIIVYTHAKNILNESP